MSETLTNDTCFSKRKKETIGKASNQDYKKKLTEQNIYKRL